MQLAVNDTITWDSAAGTLRGTIVNIVLAPNARGDTIPWIDIKRDDTGTNIRICATSDHLKAMHVALSTPDTMVVRNLMTGEPVTIPKDTPWCCNPASETYWSM